MDCMKYSDTGMQCIILTIGQMRDFITHSYKGQYGILARM